MIFFSRYQKKVTKAATIMRQGVQSAEKQTLPSMSKYQYRVNHDLRAIKVELLWVSQGWQIRTKSDTDSEKCLAELSDFTRMP